jgi:hypothetical protein
MKTAKIGAIFCISVMALAGTGAAYALWFEELHLWTDIYTGTVDVDWSLGDYWIDQGKPVSTIYAEILDWDPDDNNYNDWLRITIKDAYPCVYYNVNFDIHCVGTIPVHFTPFTINTNLPADSYDFEVLSDSGVLLENIQLHYGETVWFTFRLHFNNNIEQDTTYFFDLYTMAYQYNEDPTDG